MNKDSKPKKIRRKRCQGGLSDCKNFIGDYKDVDGVDCCEECDKYVDENPYDPYWEQMSQAFQDSKEYEELEKQGLLEDYDAYEKAFQKYHANYESWPDMRRRMAKKTK
jgi:hypothetical protein